MYKRATWKLSQCVWSVIHVFLFGAIYDRVKRLTKRMTSRRADQGFASRWPSDESRGFTARRVSYGCERAHGRSGSKRSRERLKRLARPDDHPREE